MTARRHASGNHDPKFEAAWITGRYWGQVAAAKRHGRNVGGVNLDATWLTARPVPVSDSWPLVVDQ